MKTRKGQRHKERPTPRANSKKASTNRPKAKQGKATPQGKQPKNAPQAKT
jgi:hypothetical protein